MESERLALRPYEAAKLMGISPRTLWAMTSPRGPIPCLRLGRRVMYPVSALTVWMQRHTEGEVVNGQK